MRRSQNYGMDYRPHPFQKWVRPLLCVGALLLMGAVYGLGWLALSVIL